MFLALCFFSSGGSFFLLILSKEKTQHQTMNNDLLPEQFLCFLSSLTSVCCALLQNQTCFQPRFGPQGTQSLCQGTEDCFSSPIAWCVSMGVGVRGFKSSMACYVPSAPIAGMVPSDASWLILSPEAAVSSGSGPCFPTFPFPQPGALAPRQRNAFLKRRVISYPFPKLFILFLMHDAPSKSNSLCTREMPLTFVTESN